MLKRSGRVGGQWVGSKIGSLMNSQSADWEFLKFTLTLSPSTKASKRLCHFSLGGLKFIGKIAPGRCRWQRLAIRLIERNSLVNDLAQFIENRALVAAVTAAKQEAWGTADVGLIFLGPFDNLYVAVTLLQAFDSSIARAAARI